MPLRLLKRNRKIKEKPRRTLKEKRKVKKAKRAKRGW